MGRVTTISTNAQLDYRVEHMQGCGSEASIDYRVDDMRGEILIVGKLAGDFGFTAGQVGISTEEKDQIVAVMNGTNPVTGEQFAKPVLRVHLDAKLPALPLVEAVRATVGDRMLVGVGGGVAYESHDGVSWPSARAAAEWDRMVRGVTRGEVENRLTHTVSIDRLSVLADHAGLDLKQVYGAEKVEAAERAAAERIDVRTRGFDYTFDLEKSVSVAMALDPRRPTIEGDLRALTVQFLNGLETSYARGVVGHHGDGQARKEVLGKGLFGEATFDPVSREGDPHWHVHFMFANITLDANGNWRALSRGQDDLHKNAAAENESFKAAARHMLHEQYGYQFEQRTISRDGSRSWRVIGVDEDQVRATSTRQRRIEEQSWSTFGLPFDQLTDRQADWIRDKTRPGKDTDRHTAGLNDLVGFTRQALREAGLSDQIDPTATGRGVSGPLPLDPRWTASWDDQVATAAEAIAATATERSATFRYADARAIALAATIGVSFEQQDQLVAAALNHPSVVSLEQVADQLGAPTAKWRGVYTTADVMDAETGLEQLLTSGATTGTHALDTGQVEQALAEFEHSSGLTLSQEQRAAVLTVTTKAGSVAAIQGAAGSGKTTVQAAVAHVYQAAGRGVSGTSHAAVAKEILAVDANIQTETIAALIGVRGSMFEGPNDYLWTNRVGHVLIVDEAGMVDRRDLVRLLDECEQRGVKAIFVGDSEQLPAIGATGGFDTIYNHARDNGAAARLFEVRRQQNEHERAALASWRARRYGQAMREYITAGQVRVVDTHSNALTLAAGIYRELAAGADALDRASKVTVISARNADAAVVGHLTRTQARADGQMTGPDVRFNTPGGWIDLAAGELILLKANQKIVDADGNASYLRNGRRAVIEAIDPAGDIQVSWNEPDGTQTSATISFVDVEEGRVLPGYVSRGQVLHGAGASTHSTQGGTVDRAVIIGSGIDNPNLAYTALSRDRHGVDLILDIETIAENPEEADWLRGLPPERQTIEVVDRWLAQVTEHGPVDQRTIRDRITEPGAGEPAHAGPRRRWERPDWLEPDVELASDQDLAHLEYADLDLPFDPDYDLVADHVDELEESADPVTSAVQPATAPSDWLDDAAAAVAREQSSARLRELRASALSPLDLDDLDPDQQIDTVTEALATARAAVAAEHEAQRTGHGPHRAAIFESLREDITRAEQIRPLAVDQAWAAELAADATRAAAEARDSLHTAIAERDQAPADAPNRLLLDTIVDVAQLLTDGHDHELAQRRAELADTETALAEAIGDRPVLSSAAIADRLGVGTDLDIDHLNDLRTTVEILDSELRLATARRDRHGQQPTAAVSQTSSRDRLLAELAGDSELDLAGQDTPAQQTDRDQLLDQLHATDTEPAEQDLALGAEPYPSYPPPQQGSDGLQL